MKKQKLFVLFHNYSLGGGDLADKTGNINLEIANGEPCQARPAKPVNF